MLSPSAASRLEAAQAFALAHPPSQPLTIVGATRGAADDFARAIARARPATMGLSRFSLTQLAARIAAPGLGGQGIAPASALALEAVAARAAFETARHEQLSVLSAVAGTPGFPRALARTFSDIRLAELSAAHVLQAGNGAANRDLSRLIGEADDELRDARVADRARLFAAATEVVAEEAFLACPLILLDLELGTPAEELFALALAAAARNTLVTVPSQEDAARRVWSGVGAEMESIAPAPDSDLGSIQTYLFSEDTPPRRDSDTSFEFFSAPGEGRECVEIARRVLREARRGVGFDEMAVLVRAPAHYLGLLEHALERAGVPASFERGTRRPHAGGRAFLALLACAAEGLSANRFAEYLSLGQLPDPGARTDVWVPPGDELFAAIDPTAQSATPPEPDPPLELAREDQPDIAGTLRTPRRWEWMLVEAAVIGGDPERWRRRLRGYAGELQIRLAESRRADPESSLTLALERDLARLAHLAGFALPLIREMASWPDRAPWGDWLAHFERLAPRVLRAPAHVLRVLAELRPMAAVGPVGLAEVRGVLSERLRLVEGDPPARRYGRIFVGGPAHARGRAFRVVFVPGVAERVFPQKPRQDPLLPDAIRSELCARLDARLDTRADRSAGERLLLHLAAGAATERLYLSYPRLDVAESRVRVPSFYALDAVRGVTGRIPDHEELAAAAAQTGLSTLAWPAPPDPDTAIDSQEHDLAILRRLLDAPPGEMVRGRAQYLLRLNDALRRSVIERWARSGPKWTQFDGIVQVSARTREVLEGQRLGRRPYSVSALQRFAACPYQFLLGGIHRLRAAEQPEPLQRLDPLTKGSIVHRMQAVTMRTLSARGQLPLAAAALPAAIAVLEAVIRDVAAEYHERLWPAIDRVWQEEIEGIARDLRGWLRHVAHDSEWEPRYFELSFGLPLDENHDPRSVVEPVLVDGRFPLRGAIDAVDVHRQTGVLRVTDHKTGKDRTKDTLVIAGGAVLQPLVYAAVVEAMFDTPVGESRLFFCTSAGGFKQRPVLLTPSAKRMAIEALETIDRAIELGPLAPSPAEYACTWCEFRPVCGPGEAHRVARKRQELSADLVTLRSRP
ncbi:MAG TPA: PD-(D/E)XK nuclease family protein [Vicinamibacterales bacterium]|nr:PD-(D/E)XK nuclease family protein [Vicinamibacterales bacterium]